MRRRKGLDGGCVESEVTPSHTAAKDEGPGGIELRYHPYDSSVTMAAP